jgi:ribonucleoside-diphosphate reductase beta chain
MLERQNLLPGTRQGIKLLKQDESRHIAYGIFLLSRLIAVDDAVWEHIEERMNELLLLAAGVIDEAFAAYETMPFGLEIGEFSDYALNQFQRRIERIEQARGKSLEEIEQHITTD